MASPLSITSTILLNDGKSIPRFGLGVYLAKGKEGTDAIKAALESGYRHVDTAQLYDNEAETGEAVRAFCSNSSKDTSSGDDEGQSNSPPVKREQIFITSKVWDSNHGFEAAKKSIDRSLQVSGLDYFDLFLLHSPNPGKAKRLEAYRALLEARKEGKIRSVGVSNYGVKHIEELLQAFPAEGDRPVLNQIELSPFFQREDIVKKCREKGIAVQAYSPLGKGEHVNLPELKKIADRYNKTPAQLLIRWSLQRDFICIPKSANPSRIKENAQVFDFEINESDLKLLDDMETGSGVTWDPTKAP